MKEFQLKGIYNAVQPRNKVYVTSEIAIVRTATTDYVTNFTMQGLS
jgi:hypothetical protein